MKIRINKIITSRGVTHTDLMLTLDNGREIEVLAEHEPHHAKFRVPFSSNCDDVPLPVGGVVLGCPDFWIRPTKIADLAMCDGDIASEGDELTVTSEWLAAVGYKELAG